HERRSWRRPLRRWEPAPDRRAAGDDRGPPPRGVVPAGRTSGQRLTPLKWLLWFAFDWSPPAKLRALAFTSTRLTWPAALACLAPLPLPALLTPENVLLWLEFDWSPPAKPSALAFTSARLACPAALTCFAALPLRALLIPEKRLLWLELDWSPPAK